VADHREEVSQQIGTDVELRRAGVSIDDDLPPVVDVVGRNARQAEQKLRVVGLIALVRGQRRGKWRGCRPSM
jgi:hypothetical protein